MTRRHGCSRERRTHSRTERFAKDDQGVLLRDLLRVLCPIALPVRRIHTQVDGLVRVHDNGTETLYTERLAVLVELALRMGGDEVQERVELVDLRVGLGLRNAARA